MINIRSLQHERSINNNTIYSKEDTFSKALDKLYYKMPTVV